MRLINVLTFKMEDKYAPNIPPYAILSHRWGDEEITYQMFKEGKGRDTPAYKKITNMAKTTAMKRYNLEYMWIDTCCINKMDSSELSESINSMYQWYRDAAVCIAYLADVDHNSEVTDSDKKKKYATSMERSTWFERGWTLQELVAPRKLVFYDKEWSCIGDKVVFVDTIFEVTKVPRRILANQTRPRDYSLARRMSWAANRVTTRVEDIAYCLLGIFEVSMPLLYGEGTRAFRRLQEEIVKHSSDLTILAWRVPGESVPQLQINGIPIGGTQPSYTTKTVVHREKALDVYDGALHKTPGPVPPATPPGNRLRRDRSVSGKRNSVISAPRTRSGASSPQPSMRAYTPPLTPATVPSTKGSPNSSVSGLEAVPTIKDRQELCLFAESPKLFTGNDSLHPFADDFENFTVTNRGLFISGSIYLRLLYRPAKDSSSPSTSQYLLLVGSQYETFIGIFLLKIGPNLFQRDWESDLAVIHKNDVKLMRGFLVTDWYILTDKQSANTITPKTFREHCIHVPSLENANSSISLKDTSPTHLWDVQDRLFVRPKAYAWTRYDMVLAMKCTVSLKDCSDPESKWGPKRVNFVVMCNYRLNQEPPKFVMFLESDHPKETEMLMVRRAPNNSLMWADLEVIVPELTQLPDYITVDVGSEGRSCMYRISVSHKKGEVQLGYSYQELYSVLFDVQMEDAA